MKPQSKSVLLIVAHVDVYRVRPFSLQLATHGHDSWAKIRTSTV